MVGVAVLVMREVEVDLVLLHRRLAVFQRQLPGLV
jgi:hypothetical protein